MQQIYISKELVTYHPPLTEATPNTQQHLWVEIYHEGREGLLFYKIAVVIQKKQILYMEPCGYNILDEYFT